METIHGAFIRCCSHCCCSLAQYIFFIAGKCVCRPHRICMSRIMICRQQSTITHPNARITRAFSIIYVFELNKKYLDSAWEFQRIDSNNSAVVVAESKETRKAEEMLRKRQACDKWVCGRVFIVGTCLRLNESVLGPYFSIHIHIHISSRNIWQADKRKSMKIISCTNFF